MSRKIANITPSSGHCESAFHRLMDFYNVPGNFKLSVRTNSVSLFPSLLPAPWPLIGFFFLHVHFLLLTKALFSLPSPIQRSEALLIGNPQHSYRWKHQPFSGAPKLNPKAPYPMKPPAKPITACKAVLHHQSNNSVAEALSRGDIKPTCQSVFVELHTLTQLGNRNWLWHGCVSSYNLK